MVWQDSFIFELDSNNCLISRTIRVWRDIRENEKEEFNDYRMILCLYL